MTKPPFVAPGPPPTLAALHAAYRLGAWRPSDVVEYWLSRPESDRGRPVWISTAAPAALRERARTLDAMLSRDPAAALALPLFGALAAVKDNIDVAGMATTAACPAFAYEPEQSAPVVAALEAAGAIVVGKTNLDQFATGLVGTRSPYGAVPNAFDGSLISGGSSSGSAVAVAKGWVHVALGTDTAGSGRVPAGLNNIVGWKPSRGLLSTRGVVPACRSLDCVSIFALTVPDAARAFAAASRRDPLDPQGRVLALDRVALRGAFRFATPRPEQLTFHGDGAFAAAFDDALVLLASLGGTPCHFDFAPWRAVAAMLYEGPHVAERHAAIHSFFDAHPDAMDPTVRSIVAGAHRYTATDLFVAQAAVAEQKVRLAAIWEDVDVVVVPTAPTTYTIAELEAEPVELNRRMGTYTNFVNLLDLAALAVPASIREDGRRPFGITLIGPAGSDLMLAELGARFHAATRLPLGATRHPLPQQESFAPRADVTQVAVVGAHLTGLPLNRELTSRGGRLVRRATTAPSYRLYALPGTVPPKPGMVRVARDGHAIEIEVWELPVAAFGSFVVGVPAPLSIGTLELADGSRVQGFLCEPVAVAGAEDISRFGGWRAYLASTAGVPPTTPANEGRFTT